MDDDERQRALNQLEHSDQRNPLVAALKESLLRTELIQSPQASLYTRLKRLATTLYQRLASRSWFTFGIITFFIVQLVLKILYVFILIFFVGFGWERILDMRFIGHMANEMQRLGFVGWAEIASSLLNGFFVLCGVVQIRRSRLFAFRMFARSILVSIFLTQVFAFYKEQFSALLGLAFNILILIVLRFMIGQERLRASS
jgi:hypothetical protein